MTDGPIRILSGSAHPVFARRICEYLNLPIGNAEVSRFPDGEVNVKLNDDVRGADVFVVQPTSPPVNESLMELLIVMDCLRRASARRITAVVPYFGYARQDRKDQSRVPITAKLVANLITTAGADRVLAVDLHSAQIQGFFDIPVDHLFAMPILVKYFRRLALSDLVVVSPDLGSIKMARAYAKMLDARLATVEKRRIDAEKTVSEFVIGEVGGMNAILTDDIIATGGSIADAARILKEKGARDVYICATHAVLSGNAIARLDEAPVKKVIVSDTIPVEGRALPAKFEVLSVAPLLGEAIRRIHMNESVSSLFL